MKTFVKKIDHTRPVAVLALLLLLTVSSCNRDDDDAIPVLAVSYVSLYHASPDAPPLNVFLDNQRVNYNPLSYTGFTSYLNFYAGTRNLRIRQVNAANVIADTSLTFREDQAYSLFIADRWAAVNYLLVKDSVVAPGPGKAGLRLVHLSPDAPALLATRNDANTPLFGSLTSQQASPFVLVNSGVQSVLVKSAVNNTTLLSIPDVTLLSGGVYTVIVRGFVNPPAGNSHTLSAQIVLNNQCTSNVRAGPAADFLQNSCVLTHNR